MKQVKKMIEQFLVGNCFIDLVDLTDFPDAFRSFSLIGSSGERAQLTKEIDLAYHESLKADQLKTETIKEEDHNND